MAKIVDPDFLSLDVDGTPTTEEVAIVTAAKTIELRVAGSLSDASPGSTSGVTKQCLYSFLKEEWKSNSTLNKFKFPIKAIYEAKFIMQYGWSFANAQTRDLLRDAGWQEIDGAEYACIISLGSQYDNTQQANYQQVAGFDQSTTDFDKTGPLDEPIQIYDGGSNDYRDFLKVFLRMWQRTYSDYNLLTEQGYSALTYIAYRLPLANADDIKNTGTTEAYIDTAVDPYQDMELQYYVGQLFETAAAQAYVPNDVVQDGLGRWARCTVGGTIAAPGGGWAAFGGGTWEAYPGERQIGSTYYAFNRAVQYNGVATEPDDAEIYKFCQQRLRKTSNINDDPETEGYGTVNGDVAVRLCYYVGDTLHSWPGVCFDNFNANITNDIVLHDITVDGGGLDSEDVPVTSGDQTYPFVAAGTIVFSSNLVDETNADTLYRMYFKNVREQTFDDISVGSASGANATLSSAALADFSNIAQDDHFYVSGFSTNPANNGLKKATGNGVTLSVAYTDTLGRTQVDETAGDSVTVEEKPFDSVDAIVVQDESGPSNIEGQITQQNISFDFDYDNNVQGGRDAGEDAPVVIVAQGLEDSEWIFAEFTITANTGLSFPVNAPDERTYLNPAGGPTTTSSTTTTAP
jgi:hypothetical protein